MDAHRAAEDSAAIRFAVEHGALSVDGADHADDAEIRLLAQAPIVATLTPGLVYHRGGKDYPSARRLLDNGVAVALATGFGPDSSPTLSMPMAMALACRQMGMTPEEAIVAATINAAAALGRADALGSLEPGKQADLAFFDVGDYREIPFYFGMNLCSMTMRQGRVIYRAGPLPAPMAGREGRRRTDRFEGGLTSSCLIEAVPNFSEGRDMRTLAELRQAISSVPGATLLDETADADHNRSVFTLAGPPAAVEQALVAAAAVAVQAHRSAAPSRRSPAHRRNGRSAARAR